MTEQTPTEKRVVQQIADQQERDMARWLNYLKVACHEYSKGKGFWDADMELIGHAKSPPSALDYVLSRRLMLMVSELVEAFEGMRVGKDGFDARDEQCPEFTSFEIEMADTIIRICDTAGYLKLRLGEAVVAKMAFNKSRPHMHGKRF